MILEDLIAAKYYLYDYMNRNLDFGRVCPFCEQAVLYIRAAGNAPEYLCHACNTRGDIFTLASKVEGLNKEEAIAFIARLYRFPRKSGSEAIEPIVLLDKYVRRAVESTLNSLDKQIIHYLDLVMPVFLENEYEAYRECPYCRELKFTVYQNGNISRYYCGHCKEEGDLLSLVFDLTRELDEE